MKNSQFLYWNFRTLIAWVLASLAFVYFTIGSTHFNSVGNMFALVQSLSTLVLVAAGLAIVMLIGEFDLSIAGVFPLAGLTAVKASVAFGSTIGGV